MKNVCPMYSKLHFLLIKSLFSDGLDKKGYLWMEISLKPAFIVIVGHVHATILMRWREPKKATDRRRNFCTTAKYSAIL